MKNKKRKKEDTAPTTRAKNIGRRDILKGLAAVPVLVAFSYAWLLFNGMSPNAVI